MDKLSVVSAPVKLSHRDKLVELRQKLMTSRFCTETVFGDRNSAEKTNATLRADAKELLRAEKDIMAVCLSGSRVEGYCTDNSDSDIILIGRHHRDMIRQSWHKSESGHNTGKDLNCFWSI